MYSIRLLFFLHPGKKSHNVHNMLLGEEKKFKDKICDISDTMFSLIFFSVSRKQGPKRHKPWPIQTFRDCQASDCQDRYRLFRQLQTVITMSCMRVSHGARKVSHGARKVSHGARKVLYCAGKV